MANFLTNLNTTQRYLLVAILAVVFYLVSATASYSVFSGGKNPADLAGGTPTTALPGTLGNGGGEDPSEPKTAECPLNGTMHTEKAKEAWSKRRPLAVMIENHTEARPQSGLSTADVVYEAVAEGGITRFMGVFYCNSIADVQVGPVRSARTYFLDWLSEYDALYAHVGGANTPGPADALGQIITYGIKDLNQFSIGFPTFWRDYQRLGRSVATEHTMYSSILKLWDVGAKRSWTNVDEKGVAWDKGFIIWKFADAKPGDGTQAKVTVPFWQGFGDYTVEWNYDQASNTYKRVNGGQPHQDFNIKQQLAPTNVVVQFEAESHANDGYENNVHLLYATSGQKGAASGKALFMMNGKVTEGKWMKGTRTSRTKFVDGSGQEIKFVRGQIWIETVPIGSSVVY